MENYAVFLFLLLTLAQCNCDTDEKSYKLIKCITDRECPDTMFCKHALELCVQCVNCTRYNRQKNVIRCIRDVKYCGPCIPGYTAGNDSDDRRIICIKKEELVGPPSAQKMDGTTVSITFNPTWTIIITLFLVSTVMVTLYCYKWHRNRNLVSSGSVNYISPPPPYEDQFTDMDADSSTTCISGINFRIHESGENKPKAVPFQLPTYMLRASNQSSETNNTHDNDSSLDNHTSVETSISADIHNDSTAPDLWAPMPATTTSQYESSESELSPLSSQENPLTTSDEQDLSPPKKRRRDENGNDSSSSESGGANNIRLNFMFNQQFNIAHDG